MYVLADYAIPRPGMFATVRNRRGVIVAVEPYDGHEGRLHLVHIDYKDDQLPVEEQLLWELEGPSARLLEPTALPDPSRGDSMPPDDFDALLRAARWDATMPFIDPDGSGPLERLPISSPFHAAVQVEDYQLVPLLKALRMPRVNLLIADDVGLGKTVEAGLVLSELLLRRRIERVLILTPASLRLQWRDEMWDKFALCFDLVDRDATTLLRRRLGMDANPWRAFSRIITSYHYLRQDDVLEQFVAACRTPEGSPRLPWDLIVVDECHNLMPSPFGEDSDLCRMLRLIAPQFEHRLFLSATPHNGHTRSFTGLLELLDPVRFSQTDQLRPVERERVQQVVLRRLKREINARTTPPKFCSRLAPQALVLDLSPEEIGLSEAFDDFRSAMRSRIASGGKTRRRAGSFAVEILGKRLLSCPVAFAESWRRCREGLAEDQGASEDEVIAARRTVERDTGDDRETQSREAVAAGVVGAWLKDAAADLQSEIDALDRRVAALGLDCNGVELIEQIPKSDARVDALCELIDRLLLAESGGQWHYDERLVIFTEYKTTLDYVLRRLHARYDAERVLTLYGGMDEVERDDIKQAFNDPREPVRILLATDAAAEGLNLQRTARYLLHFDCPWNPSKLEQRNGRLDRHGQARDVQVFHFMTEEDQDLRFLAHVIHKADEIREDLGSVNELFDEAAHRRLVDGEDIRSVQTDLDARITRAKGRAEIEADDSVVTEAEVCAVEGGGAEAASAAGQLAALAAELDLSGDTLRSTLEASLAIRAGRPQLAPIDGDSTFRLLKPSLPGWTEVVDESLRLGDSAGRSRGALPRLAFDATPFLEHVGERVVFNPRVDVALMHLSHPLIQRASSALTRRRFPGGGDEVSRWTVRRGGVPDNVDALVILSLEELAVNELRETFHHWVRTLAFPVTDGRLDDPLSHRPASTWGDGHPVVGPGDHERARALFDDVEPELRRQLAAHGDELTRALQAELESVGAAARAREDERYRSRQGEVSALIQENTLAKLVREIDKLKVERRQGTLFDEQARLDELDRSIEDKQAEIERRKRRYEEVREQLERERVRILQHLLPKRHSMAGVAHVFPVAIEVRLPEVTP